MLMNDNKSVRYIFRLFVLVLVMFIVQKGHAGLIHSEAYINPNTSDPIINRIKPQVEAVANTDIIEDVMVPIGTSRSGYYIDRNSLNLFEDRLSYHFFMQDDVAKRVELSTGFVVEDDISGLTQNQINNATAAKALYYYGDRFAPRGSMTLYHYGLYLPSSLNTDSKGIISQWHGVADRTTVLDPQGNLIKYSIDEFNAQILSQMYFVHGFGYDIISRQLNGYKVDQGGYPPLALHVKNGYLYLVAKQDTSRVTDKTDRVEILPHQTGSKYSPKGTKVATMVWQEQLDNLPKDTWINIRFEIIWPEWAEYGSRSGGAVDSGHVAMYMNDIMKVTWEGPLGNNDEHGTYFKYGIYKPGSTGIEVWLSSFSQTFKQ